MLRKTLACGFMALICTAAFTFVSAQYPWEVTGHSSGGDASSDSAPSGEASADGSPAGDGAGSPEAPKAAKPKKERASAPAGFSTQKSCPVCNSAKIKRDQYVPHNGQRIHVCSSACIGRVQRNPEAFVKILEKRGESPER